MSNEIRAALKNLLDAMDQMGSCQYETLRSDARAALARAQPETKQLPHANLEVMGDIQIDEGGELQSYPRALVITFDSNEAIRAAIAAGKCTFEFKD